MVSQGPCHPAHFRNSERSADQISAAGELLVKGMTKTQATELVGLHGRDWLCLPARFGREDFKDSDGERTSG
jgi:hypothetical protein